MNRQRYLHKLVQRCRYYEDVRAEIIENFPDPGSGLTVKQINWIFGAFVGCNYREDYWEYIVKLISAGADVNAIHRKNSLLHVITRYADVAKTRFLLDNGASPSSDVLDTCLLSQEVHEYAHMEITRMLISVADDNNLWRLCAQFAYRDRGVSGYTFDIALILLEAGCGKNCEIRPHIRGYTSLVSYSTKGRNMELFKMLPHTKLMLSIALGSATNSSSDYPVKFLLFNGADPNTDVRYRTSVIKDTLWYVVDSTNVVRLLLDAGAKVNIERGDLRIEYHEFVELEITVMIAMMIEAI